MPNTPYKTDHKVVVSLISERDYDTLQAIVAWPIRMAGILIASILFALVIPAVAIFAYVILF